MDITELSNMLHLFIQGMGVGGLLAVIPFMIGTVIGFAYKLIARS